MFRLLAVACLSLPLFAQLNQNCVVSVLNRSVQAGADGSWVLPNVPANMGQVKARATCVDEGVTRSGESAFFSVPANGAVNLPDIRVGGASQVPESLAILPSTATLNAAGQTIALFVTARYPDGSMKDVTGASAGTNYTTSNPAIATVSADGVIAAVASGTVVVQAINDGTPAMIQVRVTLSTADTDRDGIPDDVEIANGLNPNNPVDAEEDPDRDGLNNRDELSRGTNLRNADTDGDGLKDGEEVQRGTNPLLADTDGDLVPDGLEITMGTNPLSSTSVNLAAATKSVRLFPPAFTLTVNDLFPDAAVQLKFEARLTDNKTVVDLTARGAAYLSSNLTVCNFDATPGRVRAGSNGACTITASYSGLTATASGTVQSFTPANLSSLALPAPAANVDVSGSYAYVAATSAGLVVVNVADRAKPSIVATHDTPGSANDVVVAGNYAYVADGSAGLRIVNVATPSAPTLAGVYDSPGDAQDVAVSGNLAFVADGSGGLVVVDVTSKTNPVRLGGLALGGVAQGVDYDATRQIAVVALGTGGLAVVSVANPAAPSLLATLPGGDVRDVALKGAVALLADYSRSFTTVNLANPAVPAILGSTPAVNGGLLVDVAARGELAFGADVFFVNGVPIVRVPETGAPAAIRILDFASYGDDNGTGIAVDDAFVYLTTDRNRMLIGQYAVPQPVYLDDPHGVAPTLTITSPQNGDSVAQGLLTVTATATDDVGVAEVRFLVNSLLAATLKSPPYQAAVPALSLGATTIAVEAVDYGGNLTRRTVNITVTGSTVGEVSVVFATLNRSAPFAVTAVPVDVSTVFALLNRSAPFAAAAVPVDVSSVFSLLNRSAPFVTTAVPVDVSSVFSLLNRSAPFTTTVVPMDVSSVFSLLNRSAPFVTTAVPIDVSSVFSALNRSAPFAVSATPVEVVRVFSILNQLMPGTGVPFVTEVNKVFSVKNLKEGVVFSAPVVSRALWSEARAGMNAVRDTDRDGLPDDFEAFVGRDILPGGDEDNDGLSNFDEWRLGTNPLSPDTDWDGLADGDEWRYGCDPLNPDTDSDGFGDGDEARAGTDPRDPLKKPKVPPVPSEYFLFGPNLTIQNAAPPVAGAKP